MAEYICLEIMFTILWVEHRFQQFFEKVASTAKSVKGVIGIHDLKAEYVGPNAIQASLHIEVEKETSVVEADRIAHEVEERVGKEVNCQYCVVHVDPANNQTRKGGVKLCL